MGDRPVTAADVPSARGYEDFQGVAAELASHSTPWYRPDPSRPAEPDQENRPNIIVVLVDDLGFSDLGAFGSEIPTPNIDALAGDGWTFTNYRTSPLCSPARASLLTGLNPHRAGFGTVAHVDPGYPGYTCELPENAPTLPESLRASGYATFMVGKWHLTPESKLHDGAEKSSWPLQRGFDRYYGCMDGFTTQFYPHRLVRDNTVVHAEEFPEDFFLTDALTDEAVTMISDLRTSSRRPFFLYFSHTAVHGPIQAKEQDIAQFRGDYASGWDVLREQRFARQQELGVVERHARLPERADADSDVIPAWDTLMDDEQQLYARHMEAYAAAVWEVDASVGRLVNLLDQLGEREQTIIVIASDNGGTAEGGVTGTRSYFSQFVDDLPFPSTWSRDVPRDPALIGGPQVYGHYPAGWARASNTPFRSYKGSLYEGGVHAPLIVAWPGSSMTERGLRRQFVSVTDIAPTLLELAGVESLRSRAGREALEIDGRSFRGALTDRDGGGRRRQLFELEGARALVQDGWKAISSDPPTVGEGIAGGNWELYDLESDPTETRNRAAADPGHLERLVNAWRDEAWRNTVFPIADDPVMFDIRPETESALSEPVALQPFRPPLERFRSSKLTVLRSFSVQIELDVSDRSEGIVVSHGDQGGGYQLAVEKGRFLLAYNAYGVMHRTEASLEPLQDRCSLRLRFNEVEDLYWEVFLDQNGVTATAIAAVPMLLGMAPFTGISVGYGYGSPVDWKLFERHGAYRFRNGEILGVSYIPGTSSNFDTAVLYGLATGLSRQAQ